MKFKKVEISAFRIFDKPEDAIFDFTDTSGNVADFVSLFAPNGFGKTSFYDAVEWGMTETVQRFWQTDSAKLNTDESLSSLKKMKKKQVDLIKNSHSTEKTSVKITTDTEELPARILLPDNRKTADVSHKKNDDIENKDFRQVLLSQEWIAAFLQEVDGKKRYGKFVENPDIQEVDNYYKGLKLFLRRAGQVVDDLETEIKKLSGNISEEDDSRLLENINAQIMLLNEKYGIEGVTPISLSTSQGEITTLKDVIGKQLIDSDREDDVNIYLNSIASAKVGGENLVGIDAFFEAKLFSENAEKELDKINDTLKSFDRLDELSTELNNFKDSRKQLNEKKKTFDEIMTLLPAFTETKKSIASKHKNRINNDVALSGFNEELEGLKRSELELKNQQETAIKQVRGLEEKKAQLPQLKKGIKEITTTIKAAEVQIAKANRGLIDKEKELNSIDETINEFKKIIDEISIGQYSQVLADLKPAITDLIATLEENHESMLDAKANLTELNSKIGEQQSLNLAIEELVKAGLEIVNDSQRSSCPLCEYDYETYEKLTERITGNKALANSMKILMRQQSEVSQSISSLKESIENKRKQLAAIYISHLGTLAQQKSDLIGEIEPLRKNIQLMNDDLAGNKSKNNDYIVKLDGKSPEEYLKTLETSIEIAVSNRDDLTGQLSELKKNIDSLNEKIKSKVDENVLLASELKKLEDNSKYIQVSNWLNENYPQLIAIIDIERQKHLDDEWKVLIVEINNASERVKELEGEINTLKSSLKTMSRDDLVKKKIEWEGKKYEAYFRIDTYTHFLEDKLEITIDQTSKKSLQKILSEKEKSYKAEIKRIKAFKKECQLFEKYSTNIWDHLQSEKAKKELQDKEKELGMIKDEVRPPIVAEINKTKEYLEKKVRDFFYEELINEIYRKIDPHPDFKKVEFRPNFEDDDPRLDVWVTDAENQNKLIPNLYFSTAQINILSLSIFLASALNSEKYDCIFIDDPIQSLDSINVLSTIDLLRSIVVNQKKQIILSTHDENFHNLLKKKIPDTLFKSKFLEFETFGKVKREKVGDLSPPPAINPNQGEKARIRKSKI